MAENSETVGIEKHKPVDPLLTRQKQDIMAMRNALMSCDTTSANSVKAAMNNILVMRVYHQISRIIKYTEQMDKIEAKLYQAIDVSMETMLDSDPRTWVMLLNIQERLQKIMIDSHKLLEPYLNMDNLTYVEVTPEASSDSFAKSLLDQDSREKLRSSAQAILAALDAGEPLKSMPAAVEDDDDDNDG